MKTLINGVENDRVDILDRGLSYGDGVFETMRVANFTVPLQAYHLQRLQLGCNRLNIPYPDKELLLHEISSLCSNFESAVLKLIITRGVDHQRGYAASNDLLPTRIMMISSIPHINKQMLGSKGIELMVCKTRLARNPVLAGIKHLNRLENVLAASEVKLSAAADEGLLLDTDENVIECTKSNIFFAKDEKLYTPELNHSGVKGVIRDAIFASAEKKYEIQIEQCNLNQFYLADEIFITNTIIGVQPVRKLESKKFNNFKITEMFQRKIMKLFKAI